MILWKKQGRFKIINFSFFFFRKRRGYEKYIVFDYVYRVSHSSTISHRHTDCLVISDAS